MNLYMVHVGFYDPSVGEGLYESHMNFFVAATDVKEAKTKTLGITEFKIKRCILMVLKKFLVWMVTKLF